MISSAYAHVRWFTTNATCMCVYIYRNHLLALDAHATFADDGPNREYIEVYKQVETTMKQLRTRVANRVLLRQTTDLVPVLPNKTRWSGRYNCLKSFNYFKEDVQQAYEDESANFEYNSDELFHVKARRLEKRMAIMNQCTELLHTPKMPYFRCCNLINGMQEQIENRFDDFEFIGEKTCVSPNNPLTPDHLFEEAVYKIQMNQSHTLTEDERLEVEFLELEFDQSDDEEDELAALT